VQTTTANQAKHNVANNNVVRAMARTGYLAKGIVYLLIGGLTLLVVAGERRTLPSGDTAVRTIGEQPFGQALLIAIGIGLMCYALWRAVQVVLDPDGANHRGHRLLPRMGYAFSGLSYGALAILAFQMANGRGASQGNSEQTFVAKCLAMDGGAIIVGVAGVLVIIYALYQLYTGVTSDFMKQLRTNEMSPGMQRAALWSGRGGISARAIVFVVIGGALAELASNPFGMLILGLIATGLTLYGAHQLVLARYRQIPER
jgi:hypothetical protein